MTDALKPCPFCGGSASLVEAVGEVWARCDVCHSANALSTNSREKASDAWNTRAALAAPQPAAPAWPHEADPLTQAIQRLNATPYNLTKDECITALRILRDEQAAAPETDAYAAGFLAGWFSAGMAPAVAKELGVSWSHNDKAGTFVFGAGAQGDQQ